MRRTLKPIFANAGVRTRYRRRLDSLLEEMHASVTYWITAQYREDGPRLAQDATPSQRMAAELKKLTRRWQRLFDKQAPKIAKLYAKNAFKQTDNAMMQALKDAGLAVKLQLTPAMRDALEATVAENVALIKSIPARYLQQVQGAVMRSYTAGRDLHKTVSDINELYPVAKRRVAFIALDQANKANATVLRARQEELGITEAIWMHSHAGKHPRPSHVKADGKRYKVAQGMFLDGKWTYPGVEPGCRCTSRSVLPF